MNEDAFLDALCESPNDEVTWLALADWLEENGQAERAELVRLVRRLRTLPVMELNRERARAEARIAALLRSGVRPVVPEITNSIGMRLALIPPGRFMNGSPVTEEDRFRDEDASEEEITATFYLGVFPVTQGQYQAVIGTNPSAFSEHGVRKEAVTGMTTADYPVEMVSWHDAVEFCRRLSGHGEEKRTGRVYRLPTEAEWEYACRGGSSSTTPFNLGTSLSSRQANFMGDRPYGKARKGPTLGRTSAVGSYPPNVFGLFDVHGNVWEWCAGKGSRPQRVPIRGGHWDQLGRGCRSAFRSRDGTTARHDGIGFRVAMS